MGRIVTIIGTRPEIIKMAPVVKALDALDDHERVLEKDAALVMTDSGGLQEESCYLQVPCVTLRENTERPETLSIGVDILAGTEPSRVAPAVRRQRSAKRGWPDPYGEGTTGKRIARIVNEVLR